MQEPRHAKGCAQEAGAQTDQKLKEAFFELERRWQFLARSYDPACFVVLDSE
jgi:hypothetical protein